MGKTAIEWATHVWNPFTGCDRVSPGCAHCYAADVAEGNQRRELGRARKAEAEGKPLPQLRYQNDGDPRTSGPGFQFTVHWDKLEHPEKFPTGARVFVNSMSDVFHEEAPDDAILHLWTCFALQPDVDFLVLTKRPERMLEVLRRLRIGTPATDDPRLKGFQAILLRDEDNGDQAAALPNVWLGVTIENRRFVHRADLLRETPAAVRFVSAEPLLGPLVPYAHSGDLPGLYVWRDPRDTIGRVSEEPGLDLTSIDWLIAGGESGSHFDKKPHRFLVDGDHAPRADRARWVEDLRDACQTSGTAFFFKQWGGRRPKAAGRELNGRTWDELPIPAVDTQPLEGAAHV